MAIPSFHHHPEASKSWFASCAKKVHEFAPTKTLVSRVVIAAGLAFLAFKSTHFIAAAVLGAVFAPHAALLAGGGYLAYLAATKISAAVAAGSLLGIALGAADGLIGSWALKGGLNQSFFQMQRL